jgi:hypothetical protein
MKYELIKGFNNDRFRQVTGVNISTFNRMVEVLTVSYADVHRKRGRHRELPIEDMLLMMLEYYKEYRTFDCIGASYGITKSNVCRTIQWVETVLIRCGLFRLSGKKALTDPETEVEVVLVDSTEIPIERPEKGQRNTIRVKKRHTIKVQVVVDKKTEKIICTEFFTGKSHDAASSKPRYPSWTGYLFLPTVVIDGFKKFTPIPGFLCATGKISDR